MKRRKIESNEKEKEILERRKGTAILKSIKQRVMKKRKKMLQKKGQMREK